MKVLLLFVLVPRVAKLRTAVKKGTLVCVFFFFLSKMTIDSISAGFVRVQQDVAAGLPQLFTRMRCETAISGIATPHKTKKANKDTSSLRPKC